MMAWPLPWGVSSRKRDGKAVGHSKRMGTLEVEERVARSVEITESILARCGRA